VSRDASRPTALTANARTVLERRYLRKDASGAVVETPVEMFRRVARGVAEELGVSAIEERPGDVIPLPEGYEGRARSAAAGAAPNHLALYHFDPYSVAFRFIARGDEPDYHLVLTYLEHGWITVEEMKERLSALLPRFTVETIQQDPAEFRRKYKGLLQMWEAVRPRTTHRSQRA